MVLWTKSVEVFKYLNLLFHLIFRIGFFALFNDSIKPTLLVRSMSPALLWALGVET